MPGSLSSLIDQYHLANWRPASMPAPATGAIAYAGPSGTTLNLGTGIATSFIHLAKRACDILGQDLLIRPDPDKPEGVFSRVADVETMNRYYTPRISLDDGIERAAHYIRKREASGR